VVESGPRLGDATDKLGMVLERIVEPLFLALEADEDPSGPAIPRNENLLGRGQAKESRQVVLDLSRRYPADRTSRARRASARPPRS
jgi:hypothetical protein